MTLKQITAQMSAAFLKGADATVEVTSINDGNTRWSVSGDPAHVARAREVALASGLVLTGSVVDSDEPDEPDFAVDYYEAA